MGDTLFQSSDGADADHRNLANSSGLDGGASTDSITSMAGPHGQNDVRDKLYQSIKVGCLYLV